MELLLSLLAVAIVLTLLASRGRTSVPPADPPAPTPPAGTGRPASPMTGDGPARENDALVDGLVIGHFLTRDHYERRLAEAEDRLQAQARGQDWVSGDTTEDDWGDETGSGHSGGYGVAEDPWVEDPMEDGVGFDEFDALGGGAAESWYADALGVSDGFGGGDGGGHGDGSGDGFDDGFDDDFDDEY